MKVTRRLPSPSGGRAGSLFIATVLGGVLLVPSWPAAQKAPVHLNPIVDKLSRGEPFFGVNTGILALENARELAGAPIDFVYVDMEHRPMNLEALHLFLLGMADKAMIARKGTVQPNVALMARFPTEPDQSGWVVKQALDIGLMGVLFPDVENKAQATAAVQSMRYPQPRSSKYREPIGKRGSGPGWANWMWGVTGDEYERHADVWPLNPEGDLMAIMMVESVEGVKNIDEIASVPGVGAIFIGQAGDLRHSLGVPGDHPDVEAARQTILKGCLARKVACGVSVNTPNDVVKRIKEGWLMIRGDERVITEGRALLPRQ